MTKKTKTQKGVEKQEWLCPHCDKKLKSAQVFMDQAYRQGARDLAGAFNVSRDGKHSDIGVEVSAFILTKGLNRLGIEKVVSRAISKRIDQFFEGPEDE